MRVHGGKMPLYFEYFDHADAYKIVYDQIQSEQSSRFLKKRNRNIIIIIDEDIIVHENYMWMTLGQIKALMKIDNLVNMDTRTVISGIPLSGFMLESLSWSIYNHSFHRKLFLTLYLKQRTSLSCQIYITILIIIKCFKVIGLLKFLCMNCQNGQ